MLGGSWPPHVTGFNTADYTNGYAGNGKPIDAVEMYDFTPDGIMPKRIAKYRVASTKGKYYNWQYDRQTNHGQDGYAGRMGYTIGESQMIIV